MCTKQKAKLNVIRNQLYLSLQLTKMCSFLTILVSNIFEASVKVKTNVSPVLFRNVGLYYMSSKQILG